MGILDGVLSSLGGAAISGAASLLGGQNANQQNYQSGLNQFYYNTDLMGQQNQYNADAATTAYARNAQMLEWNQGFAQNMVNQQQSYNTNMANTAYQRSVADMKAAGLNPILGVASGGAASPPVSAPTSSSSAPASSVGGSSVGQVHMQDVIGPAVSSAMQGAKIASGLQQALSNIDQTEQQTENLKTQNRLLNNQSAKTYEESISAQLGQDLVKQQTSQAAASTAAAQAQAEKTRTETDILAKTGPGLSNPLGSMYRAGVTVDAAKPLNDALDYVQNPQRRTDAASTLGYYIGKAKSAISPDSKYSPYGSLY